MSAPHLKTSPRLIPSLLACLLTAGLSVAQGAVPTLEEKIEILQQELEELKRQVAQNQAATTRLANNTAGNTGGAGSGNAIASAGNSLASSATTIGGYGELSYNRYRNNNTYDNQADLNRFVLFFGHRFNDKLRFMSEMEVEHAVSSSSDQGEAEIEQAYLDYNLNDKLNFKAGLFLMPLGILNETHEPPTYYGVMRNEVETRIIPSTWREGGIGVYGEVLPGLRYDVGVTTGFNAAKIDDPAFAIRGGHQEMQLSKANDLSVYAALNYRAPGLLLGGGVFTGGTAQKGASLADPTAKALLQNSKARLTLWDLHGKYSIGDLDLQALYAKGTLGDADTVAAAIAAQQIADSTGTGIAIPKSFYGWYGQAAYHLWRSDDMELIPFVRYERYNTQKEVAAGFTANPLNDERAVTAGANFKLHPQVVLKADYQKFRADPGKDRLNLGVGYMF
ncbi:MAG: hypothetical protein EKK46_13565 [Rhodocyclaceae bacterium]|nr:MAG: hypothetical protein EKK46_13565 [Rhodocyclaceae bacterium]